tara:strand:- start:1692 stop:2411 length:720 start_codon:yes stop_codon:yes gene_type:complete
MSEIEYPNVSICMPIYNRNKFKELILYNLLGFIYPDKTKLEFVIDDDGTEPFFIDEEEKQVFRKLIQPIKLKYLYYNKRRTIGEKRNNLCKEASYKHIACMDSDDIYLPCYIQYSIELMKKNKYTCVGSNQMIFCYPKDKYKLTAIQCSAKRQIHEASAVFTKRHWQSMNGFAKSSQGEGAKMVDFNDKKVGLSKIQYCMVCICHDDNTINKDGFKDKDKCNGVLDPVLIKIIDKIFNL